MKKKNKKIKLNCCGEEECDCNKNNEDSVEVYVCPKCRSVEVEFIFSLKNLFGIIPRMRCNKCFFEGAIFPKWKISKKAIAAFEKERKKKSKKASYKDEIKEIYCPNCKDVVQVEMKDGSVDSFICKNCKFEIKRKK
ncbi:MAG: hypothetical protein QXX68_00110 [Candidatus Pacearchaeota archaeon]